MTHVTPKFAEVYAETKERVYRVVRRLGVHRDDVDDATQEVFIVVHRNLPGFEGNSTVATWVYGIAVNVARTYRRRSRGRPASPEVPEAAIDPNQFASVADREALAILYKLLDELHPDHREVIVLYDLEDHPWAEVAVVLGCPLKTAFSRYKKARVTLEAAMRRRLARERDP